MPKHNPKPGDRVGAIQSSTKDTVYLYGYGVYEGDLPLPGSLDCGEEPGDSPDLVALLRNNPKIQLDSGEVVWGMQCWWSHEDEVKAHVATKDVVVYVKPESLTEPKE